MRHCMECIRHFLTHYDKTLFGTRVSKSVLLTLYSVRKYLIDNTEVSRHSLRNFTDQATPLQAYVRDIAQKFPVLPAAQTSTLHDGYKFVANFP